MLTRRETLAGLAATAALSVPANAQNFTKQLHIIVPYGPGGTSDILARLIGPELSKAIGQPVIVENKPSASGNIGADYVAKQPGDGHTLLITDVGTLATQPSLVRKLSFDVQKDGSPKRGITYDVANAAITAGFAQCSNASCGEGRNPSIRINDFGPVECRTPEYSEGGPNARAGLLESLYARRREPSQCT